jgi:hypothetical protein
MKQISIINVCAIVLLAITVSCSSKLNDFTERTKIALREASNKLLLSKGDSLSLILPIKELNRNTFRLTFSNDLYFEPNELVTSINTSFEAIELPKDYGVEVIQCRDKEVAYSYQIAEEIEQTIIPCSGRYLPETCYSIQVKFINRVDVFDSSKTIYYSLVLFTLVGIVILIIKKLRPKNEVEQNDFAEKLGHFYFYPEQNKLVKEAQEIALSKKECELLALFVERPNEILKRDALMRKVWEDNGVFVGRSLDTYISKLRKKLQSDTSIKLTNVHGVGYKLEVK